jgi:hypothetical protein
MPPTRRPASATGLVLVLLVAALAVGAAASIVAAARTATSPPIPGAPVSEVYLSDQIVVLAAVLLFLAIVVPLLYDRVRGGASFLPGRAVLSTLVVVLVMVVFVILARAIVYPANEYPSGNNTTLPTNTTGTLGNTTTNGTSNPLFGNGGSITFLGIHLPIWSIFPIVAVVAIVVAVVGVPRVREYLRDRQMERLRGTPEVGAAWNALERAADDLAGGSDPREVILRLYAHLLQRVEPLAGNVDPSTPDEIRSAHLVRLGIRPETAEALTRLFEEARYSTHPLGADRADRAARAIRDAERDLVRDASVP